MISPGRSVVHPAWVAATKDIERRAMARRSRTSIR
jgi:hypothetical protein